MTKDKAIEVAAKYFPHYPKTEVFFITADGSAFTEETNATSHAKSLKDGGVFPVTRVTAEAAKQPTPAPDKQPETETSEDETATGEPAENADAPAETVKKVTTTKTKK